MTEKPRQYLAIDLKSFYASVEARELGLDPLTTNLVVADVSRTEKTICLAVSPSLKSFGIPGRARLFEVIQRVKEINRDRLRALQEKSSKYPGITNSAGRSNSGCAAGESAEIFTEKSIRESTADFTGESADIRELEADPRLKLTYIAATPRMALYMEYSTRIYQIYLRYVAPEDIHVYSIDEVLIDATSYLDTYHLTARELAMQMIRDVLDETGITATAGIGTNLYLAKVAMDIVAKKATPDEKGVRIAELDEMSYRYQLWDHRPLTDFWRVGRGYAAKLEHMGIRTMGDIARCSIRSEDILYKTFGINAELLIDHAWGWEPCTMDLIKGYEPETRGFSAGQVLMEPYDFKKARVVVQEMSEAAALDLVEKKLAIGQVVLTINYESLDGQKKDYRGEVGVSYYGKAVPKHAHGTENLPRPSASGRLITQAALRIYDRTVDPSLLIRRITLMLNHAVPETEAAENVYEQMDLFTDYTARAAEEEALKKERRLQEAMLDIKQKFGKNAILKGINYEEGATGRERNRQIGGHKA